MTSPIKTAIKVSVGILLISAFTSAAAGFFVGRNSVAYAGDDDGDEPIDRKQAFKDIVAAGRDMSQAWKRIQRNSKILAKQVVTGADEEKEEE